MHTGVVNPSSDENLQELWILIYDRIRVKGQPPPLLIVLTSPNKKEVVLLVRDGSDWSHKHAVVGDGVEAAVQVLVARPQDAYTSIYADRLKVKNVVWYRRTNFTRSTFQ